MKRLLSLFLAVMVICTMMSDVTYAKSDNNVKVKQELRSFLDELDVDYTRITNIVNEEGLSYDDAVYYYTIEKLFDYMEANDISIDLRNIKPYSDKEIIKDKLGFRNKILDLDFAALGTTLINSKEFAQNNTSLAPEVKAFYGGNTPKKVIIKSSTGNVAEYVNSTMKVNTSSNKALPGEQNNYVYNNQDNSEVDVLGYVSNTWDDVYLSDGYGGYTGNARVKLTCDLGYTNIQIDYAFNWSSTSVKFSSVDCGTTTLGAISVSNKLNYMDNPNSTSARAVGDVVWILSGSVGATFGGIVSFSVSLGASWTEMLIKTIYTSGRATATTRVYY